VIDHVGFEVSDLDRAARFYDGIFFALGWRRMHTTEHALAWGVDFPQFWLTTRSAPAPAYGHVALRATGRRAVDAAHAAGVEAGGADDGPPGPRPNYGAAYYAAYLRDPDGLRVEICSPGY
jgi:catechol 2,3-dioxygenase-like lactoylglutathione lyase family enzyme